MKPLTGLYQPDERYDMAITRDEIENGEKEFSQAFAEDAPEKVEVSEDEAFGLTPEEDGGSADGEAEGGTAPAVAIVIDPAPEDHELSEEPAEPSTAEPDDPKDSQRQKSWEGRLRAAEEDLKAREEALRAREESAKTREEPAQEVEPAQDEQASASEAVEQVAEQVESGELTAEQAIKALSDDFGDEFAKMISVLINAKAAEAASKVADEKVGSINKAVEDLISGISDDKARGHFEAIADAHPDFMEMSGGEQMKSYLAGLPDEERAAAEQVVERGSARQIIKLLDAVKAAAPVEPKEPDEPEEIQAVADPERDAAMDAAEGVRSSGLKLPEKPGKGDDYESAWSEF